MFAHSLLMASLYPTSVSIQTIVLGNILAIADEIVAAGDQRTEHCGNQQVHGRPRAQILHAGLDPERLPRRRLKISSIGLAM